MYRIDREFQRLKKRYKLGALRIHFNRSVLEQKDMEAAFNWLLYEVMLKDRHVCKLRLLSLLHELCHVKQFNEGRLIQNRRDTRLMYMQEVEAEMFSIDEYEKLYANEFGTCLNDLWSLAPYSEYKGTFKMAAQMGFGSKRGRMNLGT